MPRLARIFLLLPAADAEGRPSAELVQEVGSASEALRAAVFGGFLPLLGGEQTEASLETGGSPNLGRFRMMCKGPGGCAW